MNSLTGILALLAIMAAAHAQTCMESGSCMANQAQIKAAAENGDLPTLCSLQQDMIDCITTALADCETSAVELPKQAVDSLRSVATNLKEQQSKMCAGYESNSGGNTNTGNDEMHSPKDTIPENAACNQVVNCLFNMDTTIAAINKGRMKEACTIFGASAKCLESAVTDCKNKNMLPQDQLDDMSKQVTKVNGLKKQHCGDSDSGSGNLSVDGGDSGNDGAMGINQTSMFLTMFTGLMVIVVRLF